MTYAAGVSCCGFKALVRPSSVIDSGHPAKLYSHKRMKVKTATSSVDRMFRAFSDRTRLRILNLLLRGGELCVCDLVDVIDAPQPKVSRHLAYLRRAKLVLARKEGLWSYYRLAPAKDEFHRKLLDCLGCCFGSVTELSSDAASLKKHNLSCGTRCCP